MTIDLNTATAEELAEYVLGRRCDYAFSREEVATLTSDLNLIAAASPPGWDWSRDKYQNWIGCRPAVKAKNPYFYRAEAWAKHTGDERLDRLRLAALAWQAESKSKEPT